MTFQINLLTTPTIPTPTPPPPPPTQGPGKPWDFRYENSKFLQRTYELYAPKNVFERERPPYKITGGKPTDLNCQITEQDVCIYI